jgi:fatty-acyl-CoA synthase
MAMRDGDGYIHLIDPKRNMIISGGENIYPSEVEGVPDAKWGKTVMAVVVLHDGQNASEADLMDWCRERMAGYKRPRSIVFIVDAQMPRTATGKIVHRTLRERFVTRAAL